MVSPPRVVVDTNILFLDKQLKLLIKLSDKLSVVIPLAVFEQVKSAALRYRRKLSIRVEDKDDRVGQMSYRLYPYLKLMLGFPISKDKMVVSISKEGLVFKELRLVEDDKGIIKLPGSDPQKWILGTSKRTGIVSRIIKNLPPRFQGVVEKDPGDAMIMGLLLELRKEGGCVILLTQDQKLQQWACLHEIPVIEELVVRDGVPKGKCVWWRLGGNRPEVTKNSRPIDEICPLL